MKNTIRIVTVLIVTVILAVAVLPSVNATGVVLSENKLPIIPEVIGEGNKKYEMEFLDIVKKDSSFDEWEGEYFYEPLYEYYDNESNTSTTPCYVLVFAGNADCSPATSYGFYGNYAVVSNGNYFPYILGYWIYIPAESRVLTLRDAYDSEVLGVEKLFADYGLGTLMGDIDNDGELTVKDATYFQKCVAEIYEFPVDDGCRGVSEKGYDYHFYFSDFNRDGVRNIKDATAIQKHIAGLPY